MTNTATVGLMSSHAAPARRFAAIGAALVLAAVTAACGSDDPKPQVPEGGTGSAYNDAIIASESHDEVLLNGGDGEMVVAVDCDPATGGNVVVTVVADGLDPAEYVGVFDPATGVDITLDATAGTQAVAQAEVTLDAEEYTVTFADIEGGVFTVRGCPS